MAWRRHVLCRLAEYGDRTRKPRGERPLSPLDLPANMETDLNEIELT
jgi:hypothetical protein